jgi:hypothetical protein
MHFIQGYENTNEPFTYAKNFKTNYNVVRYGDHGTERVKLENRTYQNMTILSKCHTNRIFFFGTKRQASIKINLEGYNDENCVLVHKP